MAIICAMRENKCLTEGTKMWTENHGERKNKQEHKIILHTLYYACDIKREWSNAYSPVMVSVYLCACWVLAFLSYGLWREPSMNKSIIDNKNACKNTNTCLDLAHWQHRKMFWIEIYKWASSTQATSIFFCCFVFLLGSHLYLLYLPLL